MKIIECPRDAMQGIKDFIPTDIKSKYINTLLRVGFDTIDFGSFVSPKAIPQMSDTHQVIDKLYLSDTNTKLLSVIGNLRGAKDVSKYKDISVIGFPFSASDTFLKKNINSNTENSINNLSDIVDYSINYNKDILVYMSMGFGNPYGDLWDIDIVLDKIDILVDLGIEQINISDTIGVSTIDDITELFESVIDEFPSVEFGFHLHTKKDNWYNKIDAAYNSGVRKFDSVIGGQGGCPLSGYDMINNIKTTNVLDYCFDNDIDVGINKLWLDKSTLISDEIFKKYK